MSGTVGANKKSDSLSAGRDASKTKGKDCRVMKGKNAVQKFKFSMARHRFSNDSQNSDVDEPPSGTGNAIMHAKDLLCPVDSAAFTNLFNGGKFGGGNAVNVPSLGLGQY